MSENYRDGCSKKWTLTWFLVQAMYLASWISDPRGRKR